MTAPRAGRARLPPRRGLRRVQFPPPLLLLLLLAAVGPARGWESGDLELFDLVEEVQLNFYQFLGVQQVSLAAGAPEGGASGQKRAARDGEEGAGRARPGFPTGQRALRARRGHPGPRPRSPARSSPWSPRPLSLGRTCPPCPRPLRPAPLLKGRARCQAGPCHQPGAVMPSLSSAVLGEAPSTQPYWRKEEELCVGNRSPVSKFSPSQLFLNLMVILAASFLCLSGKIGMHLGRRLCCRSFSRAVL